MSDTDKNPDADLEAQARAAKTLDEARAVVAAADAREQERARAAEEERRERRRSDLAALGEVLVSKEALAFRERLDELSAEIREELFYRQFGDAFTSATNMVRNGVR